MAPLVVKAKTRPPPPGGEDDGLGLDEMELACADLEGNDTPGFAIVDD